jgi:hypothetical protein
MSGRDWRDEHEWGVGDMPPGDVRHFGSDAGLHHQPRTLDGDEGQPGADDWPAGRAWTLDGDDGQPGLVLARRLQERSRDPLTAYEKAYEETAAALAEPRTEGRAGALELRRYHNPDGSNLAGTAARYVLDELGIAGVGHEPGLR